VDATSRMNKILPNIAVLMAAYNGMLFIEGQLQSIVQQKDVNVTVFISVDKSSDGTYEWCCDYAKNNHQVKILPYGKQFGGAAPNFFRLIKDVNFLNFDYVALADQDDIWLSNKLSTACKIIEADDLAGYSSNVMAFWSDGREQLIDKAQSQRKYDYLFESAGPGCTYVMRVNPLTELKKYLLLKEKEVSQVILHDWFIYAFFRAKGYKWFINPDYKMRYRQHDKNQVGVNRGLAACLKRLNLVQSGWYKQQVSIISQLIELEDPIVNSKWAVLKNIKHTRRRLQDRVMLFFAVLLGVY